MLRHQFAVGEVVRFEGGETATVAKVSNRGRAFQRVLVWLDFPATEKLVPYPEIELRARTEVVS